MQLLFAPAIISLLFVLVIWMNDTVYMCQDYVSRAFSSTCAYLKKATTATARRPTINDVSLIADRA